jgi:Flp pilus assembly protein TadG
MHRRGNAIMTVRGRRRRVGLDFCRRLARCQTGSAAVEFAMVAAPFLALVFLMLNTALAFFAQQTLQTATTEAARLVMTGQAQAQGMTATQFQQAICSNATSLFDCSGIYVNVQTFSSFSTVTMLNPVTNGKFNTTMNFATGNSGDIELVQVFYQWPLFATGLGFNFANVNGGSDLLVASAAFRNEPYSGGP